MWLFKEFLDLKCCNYFRWYRELWLFKEFLDLNVFSQDWQGYERPSRWVSTCLRMMNFLILDFCFILSPVLPQKPQEKVSSSFSMRCWLIFSLTSSVSPCPAVTRVLSVFSVKFVVRLLCFLSVSVLMTAFVVELSNWLGGVDSLQCGALSSPEAVKPSRLNFWAMLRNFSNCSWKIWTSPW